MFTIIICNKRIIEDCNQRYVSFLKPLNVNNYAFLEWNTNGENLFDAVPGLKEEAEKHKKWQALIVNSIETSNFGFVNCKNGNPLDVYGQYNVNDKKIDEINKISDVFDFADFSKTLFTSIVENPIIKLANWLSKPRYVLGEYKTREIDNKKIADNLNKKIKHSSGKENNKLENDDVVLFEDDKQLLIDEAALISSYYRDSILNEKFEEPRFFVENSPERIIIVTEKVRQIDKNEKNTSISKTSEYQNFAENNLYPINTRFMLFDSLYNKQKERGYDDRLAFYTFLLIFANNDYPNDSLKPNNVYSVDVTLNEKVLKNKCDFYIKRLLATEKHLHSLINSEQGLDSETISDKLAMELFENNNPHIECKIKSMYDESDLLCEYKGLGITKDCPIKEHKYWDDQFDDIQDAFTRYMREPARAVKNAVVDDMPAKTTFYDDRIADLNEYQQENIEYKLEEVEDVLSKIDVNSIPNTNDYRKKIEEKDKEIDERIEQRMNLKQVLVSISVVLSLFVTGSIPFIASSFYDEEGRILSPTVTLIALSVLFACMLICIIVFRIQIVNMLKSFNELMNDILNEIRDNLIIFSDYISKSASIMRLNSIISRFGKGRKNNIKAYEKHIKDIDDTINYTYAILNDYLSPKKDIKVEDTEDKYEFDYKDKKKAIYDMPVLGDSANIKYLENGNLIEVPIDYVESIDLELEEMYGQYY